MTIEQTVEIPASHRLTIDVPHEVPAGQAILAFTPAEKDIRKPDTPITDRLSGCLANAGDIDPKRLREERLAAHLQMKVLVDTNVILDVMLHRSVFYNDSRMIFDLAERRDIAAFVSAVSMTDMFYILRKYKQDIDMIYSLMDDLAALFAVVPVTQNAVNEALSLRWKDFEDAVQYTAAKEAGTAYIITRNKADFEFPAIPCVSPSEFIAFYTAAIPRG